MSKTSISVCILAVSVGLVMGNYVYQAIIGHNWIAAHERTYFQLTAIAAIAITLWLASLVVHE